jgi:hypothetical protein
MASDSEASPFARAVLITIAVLALYVLSMGPVCRAIEHRYQLNGHEPPDWLDTAETAYYPIAWSARHCRPLDKALSWYLDLWTIRSSFSHP